MIEHDGKSGHSALACAKMIGLRRNFQCLWRLIFWVTVFLSVPSTTNALSSPFQTTLTSSQKSAFFHRPHHTSLRMSDRVDTSNAKPRKKRRGTRRNDRGDKRKIPPSTGIRQTWRIFGVTVHPDLLCNDVQPKNDNIPVDNLYLSPPVLQALYSRLRIQQNDDKLLDVRVVRRSLDARVKRREGGKVAGPRFTYVLDVDVTDNIAQGLKFRPQPGRMELLSSEATKRQSNDTALTECQGNHVTMTAGTKPRVIIVGAGPAGLFCALTLARSGLAVPIILERGQPVESRGRHIGALMHRRSLDSESNFCFGEGGAGTWSDGKLTTRIGRNSGAVRFVLETLVQYGAPETILVDGAPHLGTDNLVRLLRNMRQDLRNLGGEIRFGAKMTNLVIEDGVVKGVKVHFSEAVERNTHGVAPTPASSYCEMEIILGDAIVLATGHSARDVYEELHAAGVQLEAKGFAVGFRVEHPQKLINKIQYDVEYGSSVETGKGITDQINLEYFNSIRDKSKEVHPGRLPVPSYRLATDKANDGSSSRGVYSFCMCPGGQIVPSSTDADQVCVNGMSFSKRDSLWANSALVVAVSPDDKVLEKYRDEHGVLAGLEFQKDMERRASEMGGGNLTVPVQRLTDFVKGRASTSAPSSSYRLGVKPAACHEIYPGPIVCALRDAVVNYFEKKMPGFLCEDALLHAVETRTSSPVRISRENETLQAIGVKGLFPSGEGAGFAGGIVSAAVDGMIVAEAVLEAVHDGDSGSNKWKDQGAKSVGYNY